MLINRYKLILFYMKPEIWDLPILEESRFVRKTPIRSEKKKPTVGAESPSFWPETLTTDIRMLDFLFHYRNTWKIWTVWETRYLSIHFKVSSFCFFAFCIMTLSDWDNQKTCNFIHKKIYASCSYSIIVTTRII
jgi:hypothetical protein